MAHTPRTAISLTGPLADALAPELAAGHQVEITIGRLGTTRSVLLVMVVADIAASSRWNGTRQVQRTRIQFVERSEP